MTPRLQEIDVPKVRFIGDPTAEREHRDSTDFAGIELPRGEWIEMDDGPARKLSRNSHFEVIELPDAPLAPAAAPSDEVAKLKAQLEAIIADRKELIDAYHARGTELNEARARIAELEAQLETAATAAQGESNGDDAAGTGDAGAPADQGARRRANRQS